MELLDQYHTVREHTEEICRPLKTEDYVVQPVVDVSPPKWHIGHTTWFFETFILKPYWKEYVEFDPQYNFVFNSYYETVGARVIRTDRGNLSRPSVDDIYRYRRHVDDAIAVFLQHPLPIDVENLLILGLHHEQQHQELLATDIKYILGNNPLFPPYLPVEAAALAAAEKPGGYIHIEKGIYPIGHQGADFCFDNELNSHEVLLGEFSIATRLVTNAEYLEFIAAGGYSNFNYWHAEGWDWVQANHIIAPLYWHFINGEWMYYTLRGLHAVEPMSAVNHVSYYEAAAFVSWKGMRLPTEFEWETAARHFPWGERWLSLIHI